MGIGEKEPHKLIPPNAEMAVIEATAGDSANKEAMQLNSGASISDLEIEAKKNEHNRNQNFKDHFECIAIFALWILSISYFLIFIVWIFHVILPTGTYFHIWFFYIGGWLTDTQLDKVDGLLTAGAIASLLADHFKRRMG